MGIVRARQLRSLSGACSSKGLARGRMALQLPRPLPFYLSSALLQPVGTAWQRTLALRIILDQTFRGEQQPAGRREVLTLPLLQCCSGPTGTA